MNPWAAVPGIGDFSVLQLEVLFLVLLRTSVVIYLLPVIGSEQVPFQLRAGLSVMISLILYMALPPQYLVAPGSPIELVGMALRELYVGVVMGFAASFVFLGIRMAGSWMDQQAGFAMLQMFNPLMDEQGSAIGSFVLLIFGILFLMWDGHLFFIKALAESFRIIPISGANWNAREVAGVIGHMTAAAFLFGLKTAAPVLVTLLVTTMGLAIISRIMPQMNVWMVAIPLKLGLGIGTLALVLPFLWHVFQREQISIQGYTFGLIRILGS